MSYGIRLVGFGHQLDPQVDPPTDGYEAAAMIAKRGNTKDAVRDNGFVVRVLDLNTRELAAEDWDWLPGVLQPAGMSDEDKVEQLLQEQETAIHRVFASETDSGGARAVILLDPLDPHGRDAAEVLGVSIDLFGLFRELDSRRVAELPVLVVGLDAQRVGDLLGLDVTPGDVVVCSAGGIHVLPSELPVARMARGWGGAREGREQTRSPERISPHHPSF